MADALLETERMARKRNDSPADPKPEMARFELQAEKEWLERLAAAAKRAGMSSAAYLRNAANRQMAADDVTFGEVKK